MREWALSHPQPSQLRGFRWGFFFLLWCEAEEEVEKGLMGCQKLAVTPVERSARSLAKSVGKLSFVFCEAAGWTTLFFTRTPEKMNQSDRAPQYLVVLHRGKSC